MSPGFLACRYYPMGTPRFRSLSGRVLEEFDNLVNARLGKLARNLRDVGPTHLALSSGR